MSETSKVPIKVVQADLVGDCVRLNRRFELVEDRASAIADTVTGIQTQVASLEAKSTASGATAAATIPTPLSAVATSALVVNTGYQLVPGMSLKLTKTGWWKFDVTARYLAATLDLTAGLYIEIEADGVALPGVILNLMSVSAWMVVHRSWIFQSKTGVEQIQVMAKKTGGTGASEVEGNATPSTQTTQIVAVWVGP